METTTGTTDLIKSSMIHSRTRSVVELPATANPEHIAQVAVAGIDPDRREVHLALTPQAAAELTQVLLDSDNTWLAQVALDLIEARTLLPRDRTRCATTEHAAAPEDAADVHRH